MWARPCKNYSSVFINSKAVYSSCPPASLPPRLRFDLNRWPPIFACRRAEKRTARRGRHQLRPAKKTKKKCKVSLDRVKTKMVMANASKRWCPRICLSSVYPVHHVSKVRPYLGWQVVRSVGDVISATQRRFLLSHVHLHVGEEVYVIAASTQSTHAARQHTSVLALQSYVNKSKCAKKSVTPIAVELMSARSKKDNMHLQPHESAFDL